VKRLEVQGAIPNTFSLSYESEKVKMHKKGTGSTALTEFFSHLLHIN